MGSMNFNAPPLKMTMLAIGVVVILHVLTAMALVAIKPSTPTVEPLKVTPPIDIQMVTLPVDIEEIAIDTAEPVKEVQPQPEPVATDDLKSKPKPQKTKKSQPVAKTKPPVKTPIKSEPQNITSKPQLKPKPNTQADTPKEVENEPFRHEIKRQESMSTVQADALAADNERKILAAQAEKSAQQAHAKAMRDAQAVADAKAKAAREEQAAATKATEEAKASARAKAQADAAAKVAAQAASNTPVNFNASDATWVSEPRIEFPNRAKRGARSGDTFNVVLVLRVNKQGSIDSVRLAQSSGNAVLDREAQRQVRSGRFKPFTKNGVPVVGNVTLPISYAVP